MTEVISNFQVPTFHFFRHVEASAEDESVEDDLSNNLIFVFEFVSSESSVVFLN